MLSYSELFKKEFTELRNLLKKIIAQYSEENPKYESFDWLYVINQVLRDFFVESLVKSLSREAAFSQLFIPAGRSFFANLQNNIFSFLSSNNALDPFLESLVQHMKI